VNERVAERIAGELADTNALLRDIQRQLADLRESLQVRRAATIREAPPIRPEPPIATRGRR